jgi:shikimate dehydrogenase
MPHLSGIDETAEAAGAVNTLVYGSDGYDGYNTDIFGVIDLFRASGEDASGKSVAVVGAGGGARAAVCALREMGSEKIFIINRTLNRAKSLAKHVAKRYNVTVDCLTPDRAGEILPVAAVVQCSSLGFAEWKGLSPVDESFFGGVGFAADIIYSPWETRFLSDARRRGVKTANGFGMLIAQACASYAIWTGRKEVAEGAFVDLMRKRIKEVHGWPAN